MWLWCATCQDIILPWFLKLFKKWKTIVSLQTIEKQEAGHVWLPACRFANSGSDIQNGWCWMKNVYFALEFHDAIFSWEHTYPNCYVVYTLCTFALLRLKKKIHQWRLSLANRMYRQCSPIHVLLCLSVGSAVTNSMPSVLTNQGNNICDCEFSGVLTKNLFLCSMEVKNTRSYKKGDANMFNIWLALV